ncbi:N-6 DNA methylase [Microcoleus sp. FACHB-1515]|uniref:Eco57I restriction-modification methylase domain-containing protein n=1 Tax=Cyanophyceae TaxID=3028117 RepID=UPI001683AF17|nr:N-6 DNA methylase [Microcoleus sp. FACHB-1515]MBD2091435.1 N-6 DNA methylase [Microcoleus sp. FACHB-1515]
MKLKQTIEACRHEISIAAPDADSASLILSLLCLQFAQQRHLISPVQNCAQAASALVELRDRGLPLPQTWLNPPLFSAALFDRLASLTDSIDCFAHVYELLQSPHQQRAHGVFYTPIEIADYMVEQAIRCPISTILDPACGGGVFLLRAYEKLLKQNGDAVPGRGRFDLLKRCIFGVDIDPGAVAIAQIALLLKAIEGVSAPTQFPNLDANLQCGNAVVHPSSELLQRQYDAVIGNPPYLDAERMTLTCPDWRQYCTQHFRAASGNWDLFCVFIEQGLNLCRSRGITSMIVPNKLISADYAAAARSLLAQDNQLLSLRDYSQQRIFAASVYPIVFVAQKQAPTRSATIRYEVVGIGVEETHWLSSDRFLANRPWLLSANRSPLTQLQTLPTWKSIAQIHAAATVSEAYLLQPFITEAQAEAELRLINSGTIDRYRIRWGEKPLRYLGKTFDRPVIRLPIDPCLHKRRIQACQPKLIVAGMTRQLEAAIDLEGNLWPGKSTCVIRSEAIDLRYLLGLLNSQVVDAYFKLLFSGNQLQGGYLRVGSAQLRSLPLPVEDRSKRDRLITLVQARLDETISTKIAELEHQIEQLVCELYHLTDGAIAKLKSP